MSQIDVGVVGLGYFGSHHARHHAAHPGARLVAVVDADPARAQSAGKDYNAGVFGDHRDLIGKITAASVAVPTSEHHRVAGELIDAGVHVLVEKPLAADAREAADLVERANRRGVRLQVGHIERYAPAFAALKDHVSEPVLIACVRHATWSGRAIDVDVVLDLMIHDIDLALTLANAPVVSVSASGASIASDYNDVAEARLTFANGVVATLAASRIAGASTRTISATQAGRQLTADLSAQTLTTATSIGSGAQIETTALTPADNLAAEIDAFLQSIAIGTPPPVDGQAGLDALVVADMILTEIKAGAKAPQKNDGVPA